MFYKVKFSKSSEKFISKLDGSIKQRIPKMITFLENSPVPKNKKHILDTSGSSFLCEYPLEELRFYYTIENQFVVIEDIEYLGKVEILEGHSNHKSGDSKNYSNQQKTIKSLKKKFNDK